MKPNTHTKNISFLVITTLLIFLSAFFLCSNVTSQSTKKAQISEEAYINLEREFLSGIRSTLHSEGYQNCGINLTRTIETDGSRIYKISLHHKYLNSLTENELGALYERLSLSAIPFENCSFSFSLL